MNVTELIVELVLAGLLMLIVLLSPALAAGLIAPKLSAETFAAAIATGFVLGVVVDRGADTILERWLGFARCRFAFKDRVRTQRADLLGPNPMTTDCFPEDWMRMRLLSTAQEGVVRAMEQLRVRVRVARNVVVLTPALTTSAVAAALTYGDVSNHTVALGVPTAQLVALVIVVWLAERIAAFKAPHTTEVAGTKPDSRRFRFWFWVSPAIVWIAIQFMAALAILIRLGEEQRQLAVLVLVTGAGLTVLSIRAWLRITDTFMTFLWDYWRFGGASELVARLGVIRAGVAEGPSRVQS